jgi:dihydrofolate synthase/folylpolyglutamate synthase
LAAVLQAAGYKVGLYTSPHLIDFSERIRINGEPVSQSYVIDFVERHRSFFEPLHPSFFELTTAMAFAYFADNSVDVAVIEVGLGGRLDCTNIISPDLSIITSISRDHTHLLGEEIEDIAYEKAGIIKEKTPVVMGAIYQASGAHGIVAATIIHLVAESLHAPFINANASDIDFYCPFHIDKYLSLGSLCQAGNNKQVVEKALAMLSRCGYRITEDAVATGVAHVCELTGLRGRWEVLQRDPLLICDIAHNEDGIRNVVQSLGTYTYKQLRIVFGVAADKDIPAILSLLPPTATYYFTQASVARALPVESLRDAAAEFHLSGTTYPTVAAAVTAALSDASPDDLVFVGGSNFVVADLLTYYK